MSRIFALAGFLVALFVSGEALALCASDGGDVLPQQSGCLVVGIQNVGVSAQPPANGQALVYNSTLKQWIATTTSGTISVPVTVANGGTGLTSLTSGAPLFGNGTGNVTLGTRSGNTTEVASISGALTNGHCLQVDASGNLVDSGGACGGAGSSAFNAITSGTNTTAAMVVGAGASLNFTSSGTINASSLGGATFAAPGAIGGTTPAAGAFTTLGATGNLTTNVTGSTQCLHVNTSGVVSGTGSDCGAGGSVSLTAGTPNTIVVNPNPITGTGTISTTQGTSDCTSGTGACTGGAIVTGLQGAFVLVGAHTYTLAQAGTTGFASGWGVCILNTGSGDATINATTSVFAGYGGGTSLTLHKWSWACPTSDGTNYQTIGANPNVTAGANISVTQNSDGTTTVAASGAGTGNVSATTTSTNKIQKGIGTLTIGDSSITDDGTKVSSTEPTVFNNTVSIANEGTTGTTVNLLAKLTGAPSTAIKIATSDMSGISGVVVSGAGTTGSALIVRSGQASCVFDGATTAGDYVQASTTTAGDCHDAGAAYPTNGQVLGRVLSTNGAGGTYSMNVIGSEVNASNPVATASGGSVTLTGPQEVYFCTGACTITLPSLLVGQEYCVANNAGVSTAITFAALGGSAAYEKPDWSGYGTAGTGTLSTSGGTPAVGDAACLHVLDTTHVQVMSVHGSAWAAN